MRKYFNLTKRNCLCIFKRPVGGIFLAAVHADRIDVNGYFPRENECGQCDRSVKHLRRRA